MNIAVNLIIIARAWMILELISAAFACPILGRYVLGGVVAYADCVAGLFNIYDSHGSRRFPVLGYGVINRFKGTFEDRLRELLHFLYAFSGVFPRVIINEPSNKLVSGQFPPPDRANTSANAFFVCASSWSANDSARL